jgi:hypothetical protein
MARPSLLTRTTWDAEWDRLRDDVEGAQGVLATADAVPDEVRRLVLRLGDRFESFSDLELLDVDPYLVLALQGGTIQALRALESSSPREERRGVRVGLERVRQALRDVADEQAVSDDRPTKQVVRWLVETLDAPYPRVAALLRTSPRTLQRWLSDEPTEPRGEDAARVMLVAKVTNQLRHALTGEGVLRWFESPNHDLDRTKPAELLADPDAVPRLVRLAAATRVSGAT